jgi:hypothetical protein
MSVKKNTDPWCGLQDFLNRQMEITVLDTLPLEMRSVYLAIGEFCEMFKPILSLPNGGNIPIRMLPQTELPWMLTAHGYITQHEDLISSIDQTFKCLSVSKIEFFVDDDIWDPSCDLLSTFLDKHKPENIQRRVSNNQVTKIELLWKNIKQKHMENDKTWDGRCFGEIKRMSKQEIQQPESSHSKVTH